MIYKPTPENKAKIDKILEENAVDTCATMGVSMTKDERKALKDRWKGRLAKMREIDKYFCHYVGFTMYD